MTIDEFLHSVGAYHGDSKNLSATTLRAFVKLVREKAKFYDEEDDDFWDGRAFNEVVSELSLEEPEP